MITVQGKQIETDAFGYLLNIADWNEDVARHIAQLEGVELNEAHWEVIYFVRDFYQEYNTSPAIRMLVKAMSEKLGVDKGNSRYLQRLFPDGPAKQATKLTCRCQFPPCASFSNPKPLIKLTSGISFFCVPLRGLIFIAIISPVFILTLLFVT